MNLEFKYLKYIYNLHLRSTTLTGPYLIYLTFRLHPDRMQMKLALQFPEFRVTGQYRITGKIFALSVEGTGPFWAIISN